MTIDQIMSPYWQPKLGAPGEVAQGTDDISQCLETILQTPRRSVPHRPEFGCDCWLYLDKPTSRSIPKIIQAAVKAIRRWEPRIELTSIRGEIDLAQVFLYLEWRTQSGATGKTTVRL